MTFNVEITTCTSYRNVNEKGGLNAKIEEKKIAACMKKAMCMNLYDLIQIIFLPGH